MFFSENKFWSQQTVQTLMKCRKMQYSYREVLWGLQYIVMFPCSTKIKKKMFSYSQRRIQKFSLGLNEIYVWFLLHTNKF